jgi:hypothetical protein
MFLVVEERLTLDEPFVRTIAECPMSFVVM